MNTSSKLFQLINRHIFVFVVLFGVSCSPSIHSETNNKANVKWDLTVVYDSRDCINCSKEYFNIIEGAKEKRNAGELNLTVIISAYDRYNMKNFINSMIDMRQLPDELIVSSDRYAQLKGKGTTSLS